MPRITESHFLHPAFREPVLAFKDDLWAAGLESLKFYETVRAPKRQRGLYALGRTQPGKIVTTSEPWESFHQYGFATDIVAWEGGRWVWWDFDDPRWKKFVELAKKHGLRTLRRERPHVELPLRRADLQAGIYPAGGDPVWRGWLDEQIEAWGQRIPPAPPLSTDRPPLAA